MQSHTCRLVAVHAQGWEAVPKPPLKALRPLGLSCVVGLLLFCLEMLGATHWVLSSGLALSYRTARGDFPCGTETIHSVVHTGHGQGSQGSLPTVPLASGTFTWVQYRLAHPKHHICELQCLSVGASIFAGCLQRPSQCPHAAL